MMAPPCSGSLLTWISHQRAMSRRTRLRVDCDLGTLPVNVRTSRAPSLSMIRQCRKAKSKGSSFFSEKFTLNIGLGWVCVILPPHCVPRPTALAAIVAQTTIRHRRTSRTSYHPSIRNLCKRGIPSNLFRSACFQYPLGRPSRPSSSHKVDRCARRCGLALRIWRTLPLVFVFCSCSHSTTKIRDWMICLA
jgi:hypothetical protein